MLGEPELFRRTRDALDKAIAEKRAAITGAQSWEDFKKRAGEIAGLDLALTILKEQAERLFGDGKGQA